MAEIVQFSTICSRSTILAGSQQMVYLLVELKPLASSTSTRLPLNLALVLDRSGSMAGEKMRNLKEAVKCIIDQLWQTDIISIVTFENRAQVVIPAQAVQNREELKRKVDRIEEGGGTQMSLGLREGLRQAQQLMSPERVSRLILLTDGEATDRLDDSRREADHAGEMGVPIIGLGLGKNWKEDFVFDLTDRSVLSPGSHTGYADFISAPEDALRIFQEVFQSMQIVAQNVQVTIRMVQGLEARRVWQTVPLIKDLSPQAIQGRSLQIAVGDLEKGGTGYLAELVIPARHPGVVRVAQADVTYSLPDQPNVRQAADIVINFSQNPAETEATDPHVMSFVERTQAFKLQTQALSDAEEGNKVNATRKLRQAVTILLAQGEAELAEQMETEAKRLESGAQISDEGMKTIKLTSRKTIRLQ